MLCPKRCIGFVVCDPTLSALPCYADYTCYSEIHYTVIPISTRWGVSALTAAGRMGDRYEGGDNDAQQPEFKIYVGGLSFNSTKESISEAFSVAGKVTNVQLVLDKETGRLKGYGFVSFEDDKAYQYALDKVLLKRHIARLVFWNTPG